MLTAIQQCTPIPKQFVILSMSRSGTNLLISLLNQIKCIACRGEIYLKGLETIICKNGILQHCSLEEEKNSKPLAYWNEILSSCDKSTKAIGFKIFLRQNDEFLEYLANSSEFEKVILMRNPIARYISPRHAMHLI